MQPLLSAPTNTPNTAPNTAINEQTQRRQLHTMRRVATGLLVLMSVVFVLALWFEPAYPWLGFVKAFAEAAMVGALADWFAVTALFRHPLGIPIPHTAIIKTNKDRIGESLGNFVERNFLTPEIITARLGAIDITQKAAEWLVEGDNTRSLAERVTAFIPDVLNATQSAEIQRFVEKNITERFRAIDIAPIAGNILGALTAENRHQGLFDEALKLGSRLLEDNKFAIRQKIREESPWYVPEFVDEKIYERIITRAEETLREMSNNPDHELRRQFHRSTQEFIHDLKHSPEYRAKAEHFKEELLQHPIVQQYFSSLWNDVQTYIINDVRQPDSAIRTQLERSIRGFGQSLLHDDDVRQRMNAWLRQLVLNIVAARKHELATLIADTVKRWDAETMSQKIELQVGKDLQYIRINGTVVGGLVGLLIYILSQFVR
jgi:uncharacterized membrane-anchored protein YjiN (DUF445 family)